MRVLGYSLLTILLVPWAILTMGWGLLAMLLSIPVWIWARNWNRDGWGWFLFGSYLSVLVAAIVLLIIGRKVSPELRQLRKLKRQQDESKELAQLKEQLRV